MVLLKVPHNRRLRPPSLGSRFAPSPCALIVTLLSLVLLPHVSVVRGAVDMTNAKYNVPYSDCQRDPTLRKAKVGAGVDSVLALCLKSTTSLETTFENANKFFIGNMSNVASFGALCVEIAQTLAMDDDNVLYETPLPPFFMRQGFALSIWGPAPDPNLYNETVVMTLVNDGVSSLSLTGIDFAAIGEDPNFEVPPQGTVTITVREGGGGEREGKGGWEGGVCVVVGTPLPIVPFSLSTFLSLPFRIFVSPSYLPLLPPSPSLSHPSFFPPFLPSLSPLHPLSPHQFNRTQAALDLETLPLRQKNHLPYSLPLFSPQLPSPLSPFPPVPPPPVPHSPAHSPSPSPSSSPSSPHQFNRTQAALDFETLPLLQNYLSDSSTMAIDELTAVVIVKMFPDDPSGLLGRAAYVFIDPTFDSRNPYQFYLFEANYYLPTAGSGRRRLLASIPKTTTPPAGSQKGCCKKTPPPPTCKVGGVNYPACRNPVCKTPC
ncbi:unnamed protein product [Closterium sp. NIES-64]|nr:unnamed protein product [Closterium sp. NIES-64]